jgi:hypothetical protein
VGGVIAEIHIVIELTVNPSEHGVIDSFPILFNGGNEILDNSIIFHLAFPFCQIGIHVVPGHKVILIIDAVFF